MTSDQTVVAITSINLVATIGLYVFGYCVLRKKRSSLNSPLSNPLA